jgi:hypothetical protein
MAFVPRPAGFVPRSPGAILAGVAATPVDRPPNLAHGPPDAPPKEARRIAPDLWAGLVPNGLNQQKPNHYSEMAHTIWQNKRHPKYAWDILNKGVCDGCALGVAGFHDWTIDGTHLCTTRLNLLQVNTMGALDPKRLANVEPLRELDGAGLRKLGRLAYPMLRRRGEPGFRRISWDEALGLAASRIRATTPDRLAFYLTARGITNEVYYVAQKVARFLGTNNIDNAARICHAPSTGALKRSLGVAATTCSYTDVIESDLTVKFTVPLTCGCTLHGGHAAARDPSRLTHCVLSRALAGVASGRDAGDREKRAQWLLTSIGVAETACSR